MADSNGRLGVDLLVEMLSRLPAMPLFRFQCVSRSWRALIRDEIYPTRVRTAAASGIFYHSVAVTERHDAGHGVLLGHASLPSEMVDGADAVLVAADVTLGFLPRREIRDHVVGCCGGLLLSDPGEAELFVCNPATRRWVAVPKPFSSHPHRYFAVLAFDPRVSPHFRIAFLGSTHYGEQLSVYYAEKGQWAHRAPACDSAINNTLFKSGAVALGESLYVLVGDGEGLLARFDLSTGDHSSMGLPEGNRYGRIGQSQGHLHLAVNKCRLQEDTQLEVWMLRGWKPGGGDGDEGWVKKYDGTNVAAMALEQHGFRRELRCPYWLPEYRFLGFHPQQDSIFVSLQSRKTKIFACDLAVGTLREVCDVGDPNRRVACDVYPFAPCRLGC